MVLQYLLRIKYFQLNVFFLKVFLSGLCVEITLQKEQNRKDGGAERVSIKACYTWHDYIAPYEINCDTDGKLTSGKNLH